MDTIKYRGIEYTQDDSLDKNLRGRKLSKKDHLLDRRRKQGRFFMGEDNKVVKIEHLSHRKTKYLAIHTANGDTLFYRKSPKFGVKTRNLKFLPWLD